MTPASTCLLALRTALRLQITRQDAAEYQAADKLVLCFGRLLGVVSKESLCVSWLTDSDFRVANACGASAGC